MEHEKPDAPATVRLTLWPGGEERIIGQCDSHGAWVEWTQSAGERQPRNR
jgi:hypothetical protein